MEKKYIKFYKTFHKKFKNDENLILCSKLLCDGGVVWNRELVTFLGFLILPQPYRQNPFHHSMLL